MLLHGDHSRPISASACRHRPRGKQPCPCSAPKWKRRLATPCRSHIFQYCDIFPGRVLICVKILKKDFYLHRRPVMPADNRYARLPAAELAETTPMTWREPISVTGAPDVPGGRGQSSRIRPSRGRDSTEQAVFCSACALGAPYPCTTTLVPAFGAVSVRRNPSGRSSMSHSAAMSRPGMIR